MNAIAPLHWSLVSPRCGLIQSAMLPYVAWGQKCEMSALHSEKTHAAFDNLDEQPTESSLMCAWMHARMCPSPGAMPAHCAISVLRLNRCRRCRENQRRAERNRIKRCLHDRFCLQFDDKPAPHLKISQLSSYLSTNFASINPIGLEVDGSRNWAARSLFLATKKRVDRIPRSSQNRALDAVVRAPCGCCA